MKARANRVKFLYLAAVFCIISFMAGCSGSSPAPAEPIEQAPATVAPTAEPVSSGSKVYLITMDQMDQYWANIDAGCKQAVEELKASGTSVDYIWQAPDVKDDAKQIEVINNAVAAGAKVILLAANGPNAV
ncbi:MAG: substrate-binding domain-containing protein, partial [Clostridiales bacterium]|nr:substrate-binding domain-containing protein [Clostridiales bacterium]